MILVARFASKTRPKGEQIKSSYEKGDQHYPYKSQKMDSVLQKSLISLLLKKNIITEKEFLKEIERVKKDEEIV